MLGEAVSLIDAIFYLNYANEQLVVIILENNRKPVAAQSQNADLHAPDGPAAEAVGQGSLP